MADRRRRVVWTDEARTALDEILNYVVQDSNQGARKILEDTLDRAGSLTTLSDRGRIIRELEDAMVREVFVGSYRLIYEVHRSEVSILAVLHGARDFAKWR